MGSHSQKVSKYIGFSGLITIAGIIFQIGRASENLEVLTGRVDCIEDNSIKIHNVIYDIHGTVSKTEAKMDGVEKELQFIREKLFSGK